MKAIGGIITALATPFLGKWGEKIDEISFKKLIQLQKNQKINTFVINGTTGESPCLFTTEIAQLFKWTKEEAKEAILICGVGGNCTKKTMLNIQQAVKIQADAVLVVVPYYNNPPQRGLIQHFQTLAESSELPVILYNVPSRTKVTLSLQSILTLSQHPNIIAIKEASGDMKLAAQLLKQKPSDFIVLSGDDDTCFDLCALGAQGVISVVSHILAPQMKSIFQIIQEEEIEKSLVEIKKYKKKYSVLLNKIYSESNPIGIKMALKLMNIFDSAQLRSPLVSLNELATQELKWELQNIKLI